MEIEAKFTVPDQITFERLLQTERLAAFVLSPVRLKRVHDRYLDTADSAFLRGGFACRVRGTGGGDHLLTLKSLTPARGLLHMRQELEVQLPPQAGLLSANWPAGEATSLADQLSHGQPLELQFELWQERHVRLAVPGEGQLAVVELSVDRTRFDTEAQEEWLGVEAELLPAGDRQSLQVDRWRAAGCLAA